MGWNDMRPWGIKLRYILLVAFALMIFTHPPKSCQNGGVGSKPTVQVAAGDLERVYPTLGGKPFNVAMKNGSVDATRDNDIEELARDYWHFKDKAVAMLAKRDMQGLAEAERDFQQTETWLRKYNEADVSFMLSRVAKK